MGFLPRERPGRQRERGPGRAVSPGALPRGGNPSPLRGVGCFEGAPDPRASPWAAILRPFGAEPPPSSHLWGLGPCHGSPLQALGLPLDAVSPGALPRGGNPSPLRGVGCFAGAPEPRASPWAGILRPFGAEPWGSSASSGMRHPLVGPYGDRPGHPSPLRGCLCHDL